MLVDAKDANLIIIFISSSTKLMLKCMKYETFKWAQKNRKIVRKSERCTTSGKLGITEQFNGLESFKETIILLELQVK